MSKKNLITISQYIIFLGLGIVLVFWQIRHLTPEQKAQILTSFQQVRERLWLLIPVLIIGFCSHFFRALRWKLLLEPLNLRPSTVNVTCSVFVGYLVNLLLPRIGEVARCTALSKYEHEPADEIIGTIVAERSFDIVCLLFVALLAFLLQIRVAGNYMANVFAHLNAFKLILTLAIIAGVVFLLIFIYRRNRDSKFGKVLKGIGDGVRSIFAMKKSALFLLYTVLIWMSYLTLIYLGFKGLPATENLSMLAALSVLVFGAIGMIITPGGLGAYPPAVQIVLLQLFGIAGPFGLAFGWISWLAQTCIILIFGLLSLLVLPAYNRKPHAKIALDNR